MIRLCFDFLSSLQRASSISRLGRPPLTVSAPAAGLCQQQVAQLAKLLTAHAPPNRTGCGHGCAPLLTLQHRSTHCSRHHPGTGLPDRRRCRLSLLLSTFSLFLQSLFSTNPFARLPN